MPETLSNVLDLNWALTNKKKLDVDYFQSLIYLNNKNQIINPESKDLVDYLNQRKIKTIALTALSRGPFGVIPEVLLWRLGDLKQLGYHFSEGFPKEYCFQFKNVVNDALPAFKEGVLFSSYMCKGKITKIFLDRIEWKPSKAVIVDDQLKHVESFTKVMNELGIESSAYHYTEAEHTNSDLDLEVAELQIRHLLLKHQWITDEVAEKMCKPKNV